MALRSEAFRVRAQETRRKIGTGDPRLDPVWENIARAFASLSDTARECERPTKLVFEFAE